MTSDLRVWIAFWLDRLSHDMEIRAITVNGDVTQTFSRSVEEIGKAIDKAMGRNDHVYFGVLGRHGNAGGKENVSEAHCIWTDIDFKDLTDGRPEADAILATFDHRPSMLIYTGGGYHVYWFLAERTNDVQRAERIVRGLVPRLKGDPQAVDWSRVLRVPWTFNQKYIPPVQVEVISFIPEQDYSLDDFAAWEEKEVVYENQPADESESKLNLKQYLKYYKIPVVKTIRAGTSLLYCLKQCLFEEGHTTAIGQDNQAAIGQQADGKLFYQCFHSHCADKVWDDAKRKISGDASLAAFTVRDLKKLIDGYVGRATGQFSIGGMTTWLEVKTFQERELAASILADLERERVIVRVGNKHGVYRPVDKNPQIMDIQTAAKKPLKLILPLDLHRIVHLYPRNIILVAGEKDAGKTSFAMNAAFANRDDVHVTYFNSEMGAEELKTRISLFPDKRISEWAKITWIERASRFEDFIDPNGFNIIDFLEVGADAYAVVEDIKRVFDRLLSGVMLIVMQKRSYKEWAVGGEGTLEKARLAVNLEHRPGVGNVCKITVAKNWTGEVLHPRGRECKYKTFMGGKMEIDGSWYDPDREKAIGPRQKKLSRGKTDKDFPREGED